MLNTADFRKPDGCAHTCHVESLNVKSKNSALFSKVLFHVFLFVIICLKLYGAYFSEVVISLWLFLTTFYVGREVKEDCHMRVRCFWFAFLGVFYVILINLTFFNDGFHRLFIFLPPSFPVVTITVALQDILIWDCSLKLFVSFIKACLMLLCPKKIALYDLGTSVAVIERFSDFLRNLPAGVIWFCFLTEVNCPVKGMLLGRIFLGSVYAIFKLFVLYLSAKSLWFAMRTLKHPKPYIVRRNSTSDNQCPVCQETFINTGILTCNDKLCVDCAEQWCNLYDHCPVCNAQFHLDRDWRDGSMDLCIQFY